MDDTSVHIALREALVNTLVHCNYAIRGNILVKHTGNGFVMRNPGRMLVSVDDFYAGSHSTCRNPLIQNMFSLLGYGEHAGSGADIIVKGWMQYNWERPTIQESVHPEETTLSMTMGEVRIQIARRDGDVPSTSQDVPSNVPSGVPSDVPSDVPGNASEIFRLAAHLSSVIPSMTQTNQSKALSVLLTLDKRKLSTHDIMELIGDRNRSRVRKNIITPLVSSGLIDYTLADNPNSPTQTYQLTERGKSLLQVPEYIRNPQSLNVE
ncbi:MAG: hypothetical protein IJT12_09295 [Paludibacteraceae bacterium]|nr:hypothetical protein [Paludibacteraceae bacterium]